MRAIDLADLFHWLPAHRGMGAVVAMPPDMAELGLETVAYRGWLRAAVTAMFDASTGPTVIAVTDRLGDGVWFDKAALVAGEAPGPMLWHKIALRRPVDVIDIHRPTYTHLMAFGPGRPGRRTPDVIPPGPGNWRNGVAHNAAEMVADYLHDVGVRTMLNPCAGTGTFMEAAADRGITVHGCDVVERHREGGEPTGRVAGADGGPSLAVDAKLPAMRARSAAYLAIVEPWIEEEMARILTEDTASRGFTAADYTITATEDRDDLAFPVDYRASMTNTRTAGVAFRGRDVERTKSRGRPIRQMTLRRAGRRGHTEEERILSGAGDYYVTVWMAGMTLAAGIIVDLAAFRALPPRVRGRLEHPAMSNVPFVGYDAAALIAHGCVRAAYPDVEYFTTFGAPAPIEGQEALL